MKQSHSTTFTNPYRKGSAFNPSAALRERAIDDYMDDHPSASANQAASTIDELFRDWVEEHI